MRLPAFYIADRFMRNSEPFSNFPLKSYSISDLGNLFVGQTTPPVGRASRPTPFCLSIAHVVNMATREQVRRVYAGWIIAVMQNVQAVRDGTVRKRITKAVGLDHLAVHLELPVPITVGRGGPDPAVVRLASLDVFPEAFLGRLRDGGKRSGLPLPHVVALTKATSIESLTVTAVWF